MAIRSTFTTGEVLTAADLTDTIKGNFINTDTSTARTFGTADAGNLVTFNNNSGGTATIPTNTTWGAAVGTTIGVANIGTAGSFTIGTAAGVTLNAAVTTLGIQESGSLVKMATNTWWFFKGGGLPKASYSANTGAASVDTTSRPGKTIVTFNGSGTLTLGTVGLVEVLCIGGGGGGSTANGGGGGAGGYVEDTSRYIPVTTAITITVGAGGTPANNGQTSVVGTFVVGVGGGAGSELYGGSGGGAANTATTGTGVSGQGNNGGTRVAGTAGGGGGGASAVGGNAVTTTGGNGGAGTSSSINGSATPRGGGGGGAGSTGQGTGGTGGGGAGHATTGVNGSANTGGGGGAAWSGTSGTGGTGVVIVVFG